MLLLLGVMQAMTKAMDRPSIPHAASDFSLADFQSGCVASGVKGIRAAGGDLTKARPFVETRCSCLANKFKSGYSDAEKESWASNPNRLKDPRFTRIMQICAGAE